MKVQVKLFARAHDLVGKDVIQVTIDQGVTVKDLRNALAEQYPELQPLADQLFIAIDEDYAGDDIVISEQATIACFPPVSGG